MRYWSKVDPQNITAYTLQGNVPGFNIFYGIAGLFLGIPGILLGPFAGAVIGELSLQRSLDEAGRAGFGTVVGLALGVAGKLAIGIAMIGMFLLKRFI
jgi:uncharacterized protein YqgC (DUF456 family)